MFHLTIVDLLQCPVQRSLAASTNSLQPAYRANARLTANDMEIFNDTLFENMDTFNDTLSENMEVFNDTLFENNFTNRTFDFDVSNFEITSFPVARLRAVKTLFQVLLFVGLLGNALVIAVHVKRLTTSTKIYMFSLAVADSLECAVGMVTGAWMMALPVVIRTAIVYIVHVAIVFSMSMLSFVALERCMAVLRPHHFSLNPRRASRAATVIAVFAAVYAAAAVLAKNPPFHTLFLPLRIALVGTVLVVIFLSYNTVGIFLLVRAHHKRRAVRVTLTLSTNVNSTSNIGAGTSRGKGAVTPIITDAPQQKTLSGAEESRGNESVTPKCTNAPQQKTHIGVGTNRGKETATPKCTNAPQQKTHIGAGTSRGKETASPKCTNAPQQKTHIGVGTNRGKETATPKCTDAPQQKTHIGAGTSRGKETVTSKSTNAPQQKSQSRLLLLFVVTAVYIACWLPFWLYSVGVAMPHQLSQVYVLHPFVNPMIYIIMSSMFRGLVREFYRNTRNKLARRWC